MKTMEQRSAIHNTFVIERNYPVAPERVFAAFADPGKKRHWFAEGEGREVEQYERDFRVGGKELSRFRITGPAPVKGMTCTNETSFLDIVPDRRVVFSSAMALGEKCISASLVTFELVASGTGTGLTLTHQAAFFEGGDGPERRQEGWLKLLEKLAAEFSH